MRILLTGSEGYVGKALRHGLSREHDVTCINRKVVDLTDQRLVNRWFDDHSSFDVVVHAAAVGGNRLIKDTWATMDANLQMHYNLMHNRNHYARLLTFGSGAEIFQPDSPYGLAKRAIANSVRETDNMHNLRIFAVFDENELDRRFIKANLLRYIHKEPMTIHSNKVMDFIYMKDLVSIVRHFIVAESPPREINCSYREKASLLDIAEFINCLSDHRCFVDCKGQQTEAYSGDGHGLSLPMIGLYQGIRETYKFLLSSTQ